MKKHFTKVLCSLLLLAAINPTTSFAQKLDTFSSNSNDNIISSVCNTRNSNWHHYDDGNFKESIGGPASFQWGIMLPSTSLNKYVGQALIKVSFFDAATSTGDVYIYYGGNSQPDLLVHRQAYEGSGTKEFVEIDLSSPLPIFEGDNIWVILSTNDGGNYPAAISKNTGDKNGRWISLDGKSWDDVTSYQIDGTFMIRAYITGGESINEFNSSLNIYPNPAKDQLFIESEIQVKEVSIFDIYGRQQLAVSGQQSAIDVSNLSNGVYFVKVKSENNEVVKRFIKK